MTDYLSSKISIDSRFFYLLFLQIMGMLCGPGLFSYVKWKWIGEFADMRGVHLPGLEERGRIMVVFPGSYPTRGAKKISARKNQRT